MTPQLLFEYVFAVVSASFLATGFGYLFLRLVKWFVEANLGD